MSETIQISGYCLRFGEIDAQGDVIDAAALSSWFAKHDPLSVPMFYQHDEDAGAVGVWRRFEVDELGLFCEGELCGDSRTAKKAREYVTTSIVGHLSFGGRAVRVDSMFDGAEAAIAWLDVTEVSLVILPAQLGTDFLVTPA